MFRSGANQEPLCPSCQTNLKKKLCDDFPGLHTYILFCPTCNKEYGEEWSEPHHPTDHLLAHSAGTLSTKSALSHRDERIKPGRELLVI